MHGANVLARAEKPESQNTMRIIPLGNSYFREHLSNIMYLKKKINEDENHTRISIDDVEIALTRVYLYCLPCDCRCISDVFTVCDRHSHSI